MCLALWIKIVSKDESPFVFRLNQCTDVSAVVDTAEVPKSTCMISLTCDE